MLQETTFAGKKANEKNRSVSGADLLLRALENEKVEVIFGYPGGAVLPIYDKIYDSKIRHILPRHEQGGIHAAEGYARITGNPVSGSRKWFPVSINALMRTALRSSPPKSISKS